MNEIKTSTQTTLKSWPSPQDYNEAIQDLTTNCEDPQLRNGIVQVNALGIPRPLSGSFASVYRVQSKRDDLAVRCFLRDIKDQERRYALISDFVQHDSLPYTVTFDFVPNGIRINGNWHPVLKMDWLDGLNLDLYVEKHRHDQSKIARLAESFKQMCSDLQEAGIAHGDLQHGNIIVCNDELRLVDYDGMYVPSMTGMQSNEIGHRNYQHPRRNATNFGPYLDNFSAWVIYASLRALALDPSLFDKLGACDDCLLFRRDDYIDPEHSFTFALLEQHSNPEIVQLTKFIRWQLRQPIGNVPPLTEPVPETPPLPAVQLGHIDTAAQTRGQFIQKEAQDEAARAARQPRPAPPRNTMQSHQPAWNTTQATSQPPAKTSPQPVHAVAKPIEPELLQPTPRPCKFSDPTRLEPMTAQWLMLLNPLVWIMFLGVAQPNYAALTIICGLINLFFEFYIWLTPLFHQDLVRYGQAAKTKSLRVGTQTDAEGGTSYWIAYSFESSAYRTVDVKKFVPHHVYERIEKLKGEPQTVLFLPIEPDRAELYDLICYKAIELPIPAPSIEPELRIAPPRTVEFDKAKHIHPLTKTIVLACSPTTWLALVPNMLWVLGPLTLFLLLLIWRRPWIEMNIVRNGLAAEGKIIEIRRADPAFSLQTTEVDLEFFTNFGQKIRVTKPLSVVTARGLNPGDTLTVLYNPATPERDNIVYKEALFRAK